MEQIEKKCADHLRTFVNDNYEIKLISSHAHELVAASFGYKSKAALDMDAVAPINNLRQAEIIVTAHHSLINLRRENLHGLSSELPDSYTIGKELYGFLFSGNFLGGGVRQFKSFNDLAKIVIENDPAVRHAFNFHGPTDHTVFLRTDKNDVLLEVLHSYQTSAGETLFHGSTFIKLPRVAGYVGFGIPKISTQTRAGYASKYLML